jgi:hypothetical protein
MGFPVHASGSIRVNAHRAEQVHAIPPYGPTSGHQLTTALCGKQVQVWGHDLFDSDKRSPGGVCPVCAAAHRRSRGAA